MTTRPVIVVEDDPFPRMLKAFLDPTIEPQRLAALADFFAHDLPDFAGWLAVIAGEVEPPKLRDDERVLVTKASEIAPSLDWSNEPWKALAEALKSSTGLKGKALFHPLRLALTGHESGPEMAGLLDRMGQDRAVARLTAAANR